MRQPTTDEELAARRAAFQNLSIADRQAKHDQIAAKKADVIEARRELGRR